jgi:uncharacterized membrane protein YtjA (UPF0391 family)
MLWLAVVLLLIALLASFFGSPEVAGMALWFAKIAFVIFIVLLILSFVVPGPYWWGGVGRWGP